MQENTGKGESLHTGHLLCSSYHITEPKYSMDESLEPESS